jgi:hypothetical protein
VGSGIWHIQAENNGIFFAPGGPPQGDGVQCYPIGYSPSTPSSYCPVSHVYALDTNKTSWADYASVHPLCNMGIYDQDMVGYVCCLHQNEGTWWMTTNCGGDWALSGNYDPIFPPTEPGWCPLVSHWTDTINPNWGVRDLFFGATLREHVALVGVARIEMLIDGTWVDVTNLTKDLVTGATYHYRAVPNPIDIPAFPSGTPLWYCNGGPLNDGHPVTELQIQWAGQGIFVLSASCGSTSQGTTVRAAALVDVYYKRVAESGPEGTDDAYLKKDGGGYAGDVLAGTDFTYKAWFDPATLASQEFANYNPPVRFDAYVGDVAPDSWIVGGSGMRVDLSMDCWPGIVLVCYSDINGDGFPGANEPQVTKLFNSREKTVHNLVVRYASDMPNPSDDVATALGGADRRCFERDDPTDYRALVHFAESSCTQYLDVPGITPTHILTSADASTLLGTNAIVGDVIIPATVADLGWAGVTRRSKPRIIIKTGSDDVYAHEMGHYAGWLPDYGGPSCNDGCLHVCEPPDVPTPYDLMLLMYHSGDANTAQDFLREDEAGGYERATH